jgi:hypothetical protein
MFNAKQINRTMVLAAALATLAAPTASARVADAQNITPPVAKSALSTTEHTVPSSGLAELVTHHEAIANAAWQRANPPTMVTISRPGSGTGFDLQSAGIGAAVVLTLILLTVLGHWTVRRRRVSNVGHRLA